MKLLKVFIVISLILLTACSGIPLRLKSTADQSMKFLLAEMAIHEIFLEPVHVGQHQFTEEKWCLTYQLGSNFYFSSIWEKQEYDWIRTDLRSYTSNCNWAR